MNAPLPDTIWTYDENGKRLYGRPNYAKPGVAARVERECFESECAADPIRSSLDFIIRARKVARFEDHMKQEYGQ